MLKELTKIQDIENACKAFGVSSLYVFGSASDENYSDSSDVDLIVDFQRDGFEGAFEQFMGFKERMESILGRQVDLITGGRFRNRLFEQEIERTKRLVYAA